MRVRAVESAFSAFLFTNRVNVDGKFTENGRAGEIQAVSQMQIACGDRRWHFVVMDAAHSSAPLSCQRSRTADCRIRLIFYRSLVRQLATGFVRPLDGHTLCSRYLGRIAALLGWFIEHTSHANHPVVNKIDSSNCKYGFR